jgi:hypothetical protein
MNENLALVLIHSPLVGPFTWSLAAEVLTKRGFQVAVPVLTNPADIQKTYWQHHVESVGASIDDLPNIIDMVLIAHSGSGPLLPAVRENILGSVVGYLFVDALLPENEKSRLDLFYDPEAAGQFRKVAKGGLLPTWSANDLREVIPDEEVRARFASELSPLPIEVYEEPIPVFKGWPDAPCGYLRFGSNPAYEAHSQKAIKEGYAYTRLEGGHFHMLVEPQDVAQVLVELVGTFHL